MCAGHQNARRAHTAAGIMRDFIASFAAIMVFNLGIHYGRYRLARAKQRLFTELSLVEDAARRDEVWGKASAARHDMGLNILLSVLLVAGLLGGYYLAEAFSSRLRLPADCFAAACTLVSLLVFSTLRTWLSRRRLARRIRLRLRELRIPVCLTCGYNLTGLTEPRCPECGEPYDLQHCPACDGLGYDSRVWQLQVGLAILVAWAALTAFLVVRACRRVPPMSEDQFAFFVGSPLLIALVGAGFILWYVMGGRRETCATCFGQGKTR
jgi:hypothetical protein